MDAVSRPVEPGDAGWVDNLDKYEETAQRADSTLGRYSGYVVEHQGVRVRFNRHKDAMAVLQAYPEAKIVV